ncbi:MAG: diaminopimelate decarboxylase, partial [Candidatus Eremiobacteraeota bacterium]|nr:diaminopimelate decarboxylase [Candidatus Eremiobacteraeota bacterium]
MSTRETTSFGNISASKLAEIYGTPLLVIDGAVLTAAIDEFVSASASTGVQVTYAGKALLLVGIAQLLKESRLRLEVCSLGELTTAQRAGFPPSRIDLHGSGKTDAELRAAADGAVSRTIVDGIAELRALASYASPSS